ncbi:MAG TPA: SEC-C metal-binding domain-containing protein [Phenylobacterium sp.]|uniref:SEC-C metal-binding domain-containing protein n=1 Tax=Phenylobacterium sp. TaxID=1871053 RepID=UPI002BB8CF8C|nr:SEC-C metal-binding domain-containing protein [Phenylobacterium sp.]
MWSSRKRRSRWHGGELGPSRKEQLLDAPELLPGRNDPCPCGSGMKHKKCCGAA